MDRRPAKELEAMIDAEFARIEPGVESGRQPSASTERRVILVDGFNVLHAVLLGKEREDGWWRREPRERLLRRIADWPEGPDEIWVAFDGTSPAWSVWAEPVVAEASRASAAVIHSVYVESADDWIVRRARRAADPEGTIVVSGDRKVTGRARSAGCEVWSPWGFVSKCPEEQLDAKPTSRELPPANDA